MKPTQEQKDFLADVAKEILFVQETNDINSPSHYTLCDEAGQQLAEKYNLTENMGEELAAALSEIISLCIKIEQRRALGLNNQKV